MRLLLTFLVLLCAGICSATILCADDKDHEDTLHFSGKLSALKVDEQSIGDDWRGPSGLVIDNVNDLSTLRGAERTQAALIAPILKSKGVKACADFTYTKASTTRPVPDIVTLRIFVFESAESAREWWKQKYEADGWQGVYKKVDNTGDAAVDSKELPKRIILSGNCLLTCHQLPAGGNDYLRIQSAYLEALGAEKHSEK